MGFSEDDRVRSKNQVANDAYSLYQSFKVMKYSDADIVQYAEFALLNTHDLSRCNVYRAMIKIARSTNATAHGSTNSHSGD
jgi:hypothetical protein